MSFWKKLFGVKESPTADIADMKSTQPSTNRAMRTLFSSEDGVLPFPFYGMTIRVPNDWEVQDAMYPNRIDLDSSRGHVQIWFKDWTDNDKVISDKATRRKSYENAISGVSTKKLTFADTSRRVRTCDNIVYLEYSDMNEVNKRSCMWFSMVYGTCEVQIALITDDPANTHVRHDFDSLIAGLEF